MLPALMAAALVGLPPRPPIVLHYRVDLRATRHMDRSASDTTGGDFQAAAYLSVTLRDTTGGQVGRVVIDSVACSGTGLLSMAYDPAVGRASRGAWYDVVMVRGMPGKLPKPSVRNPLTDAIAPVTLELFPPPRATMATGDAWVDTLDIHTATERWTESSPAITRWRVLSSDNNGTSLVGDLTVVVTVSGQVTATGMIVGKRIMQITPSGVVRSASLTTTQQMLAAAQAGAELRSPRGTTTATISLLPAVP